MGIGGLEVVRVSNSGRKAYTDSSGNLYLDCTKCGVVTIEDGFSRLEHGFLGRLSQCKSCMNKRQRNYREVNKDKERERMSMYYENNKERQHDYMREYYQNNKERLAGRQHDYMRNYREVHKEKLLEYKSNYNKNNPEKMRVHKQRRRARKRALPDTLTLDQLNQLGSTCVLTGQETVHLDHVIPLSIGHGGTTYENMIPLSAELNISKRNSNVFEWAEQNHTRLGFSMDRFKQVMTDVASRNGMTLGEYRDYVYWCFDNPIDFISPLETIS